VRATFAAIMDPVHRSPRRGSYAAVRAIDVIDRYTVKFVLQEIYCSFPYALTVGICPRAAPGGKGPSEGIGSLYDPTLEARRGAGAHCQPQLLRGRPRLDWIHFRILANTTTRLLEMKKGGVDLLQNCVPAYAVKFLERVPGLQVIEEPGITYQYLGYNLLDPFSDTERCARPSPMPSIARRSSLTPSRAWHERPTGGAFPLQLGI